VPGAAQVGARLAWNDDERRRAVRDSAADPRCHVIIGVRSRAPALARALSPDESAAVLGGYRRDHPRAYRSLGRIVEKATDAGIDEVPMVELTMDR
jgi:hypothetical protein